ncbi:MAG: YdcH family protein [Proteobacteria bacterium]|nr:YdcH family protein [Pseudomonadota bacterium]MBS0553012.1 YdcH family protein [Pseudomonadota bacterium]
MFPEYRDLITQLKTNDRHFLQLFDRHNALDQQIKNIESHVEHARHEEVEVMKKEKLLLKDQMYAILKKSQVAAT